MDSWLAELRAGDKVILEGRTGEQICIIERFTKTQIVLENTSTKYNRQTGYAIGEHGYYSSVLRQATDEALQAIREHNKRQPLLGRIRSVSWHKLPTDLLQRILDQIGETNV